ncbi:MAG: four helix bundle protein [Crocinitomicaceae bacterium]|nr:four helix bundle protein [Crocinitomicaceae bacterium]
MELENWIFEEGTVEYGKINSYRDLIVWQKAMDLVVHVYEVSKDFPSDEKFGITNQIRRAAVSVPSNIAEGWGRKYLGSYIQFLRISYGSICELNTQLEICVRLNYVNENDITSLKNQILQVEKMIKSMISKLELKNN